MNFKLFTVDDKFYLGGRNGTVITGELGLDAPQFNVQSSVVLIKPDESKCVTQIAGIEMIKKFVSDRRTAILIRDLTKEDIPIGTEVFIEI